MRQWTLNNISSDLEQFLTHFTLNVPQLSYNLYFCNNNVSND